MFFPMIVNYVVGYETVSISIDWVQCSVFYGYSKLICKVRYSAHNSSRSTVFSPPYTTHPSYTNFMLITVTHLIQTFF